LKAFWYFQKVEIKETKQDEKSTGIQTFVFQMTAEISPPRLGRFVRSSRKQWELRRSAIPAKKG